jgi:hypothetical protein
LSAAHEIISALVAGGMDPIEAASLVARAAIEMTAPTSGKTAGALRQQRYRERHKASQSVTTEPVKTVTERNETVTRYAEPEPSQSVTNRNESVTPLRSEETPISYLRTSSSKNLSEKKESKKERVQRKRNAPLPDGWQPSLRSFQIAEQCGQNVQIVEQIFRDYLKSSGKLYADHDAAFHNFIRNQQRFNGNARHGTSQATSLTASIRRELAELEQSEGSDFALPNGSLRLISN